MLSQYVLLLSFRLYLGNKGTHVVPEAIDLENQAYLLPKVVCYQLWLVLVFLLLSSFKQFCFVGRCFLNQ